MALSLLRRRPSTESHEVTADPNPSITQTKKGIPSLPPTFLLLILITIWFTSIIFSSSFHLCFYSRKLQPFCITGETGSQFQAIKSLLPHPLHATTTTKTTTTTFATDNNRKQEIAKGIKEVEAQMRRLRSWSSESSKSTADITKRSCQGRGVFVYDLPPKFNHELMGRCSDLLPWTDLCDYFANEGMGQPIPELGGRWYRTHQYALESIFHLRVLNHPCRVHQPEHAKLFYVPYYGGLDILRWHFKNSSDVAKDALSLELIQWLEKQAPWVRSSGRDHMFVLGKISWDFRRRNHNSWGNNFLSLEAMQNPYKFLIERQPWEINDIGIPHPTHFHPHTDNDITAWQSRIFSSERRSLVSFAGGARPEATENIRSALIKQCTSKSGDCRFLDCGSGSCQNPGEVITMFMDSEFCLQPPGDSPTRKSVFDSLVSGCIPVLFDRFTAYYQYPWHLPEAHQRYSVFVDQEEVREGGVDVIERLKAVPLREREEMRRCIVYELMPGIIYGDSSAEFVRFRDAFGIVMDNMMEKVMRSEQ